MVDQRNRLLKSWPIHRPRALTKLVYRRCVSPRQGVFPHMAVRFSPFHGVNASATSGTKTTIDLARPRSAWRIGKGYCAKLRAENPLLNPSKAYPILQEDLCPPLPGELNAYNAFSVTIEGRGGRGPSRSWFIGGAMHAAPRVAGSAWHRTGDLLRCGCCRGRRPRRPLRPPGFLMLLEADLGCVLRARACLEVVVVALEAAHAGPNAVRELTDEGVVVLDGLVVAPARDADAVFCTGQFVR